jgi:flagellar hook-basal body complex protein FliE
MLNGVAAPTMTPSVGTTGVAGPAQTPITGATPRTEPLSSDFGAVLGQMAMDAIGVLKTGEAMSISGVRGGATTQQVVEAVMAAEQTLQTSVAIRDKVVSAYLEISRMSI